jgi:hypothetical protein
MPKIVVLGVENWDLQKLLDRMRDAGEYNCDRGWASPEACPAAWRAYCLALDSEYRRRGQPGRLF